MRPLRTIGLSLLLTAAVSHAYAEPPQEVDHKIPPGYQPEQGPDEKGIWMEVEEYEKAIKQSALLVTDPDINNYVDSIVCRVAGPYCQDFRVYVIRNPGFNASMTATGMMQVWTGLLLRTETTDEVAAVIGHEIAHYTRLHSLEQLRRLKKNMAAGSLVDFGIAVLTGVSAPVATATAMLNALAFSREQESEADFLGARLVAEAGYDPHAAYRIWQNVIAEEKAAEVKRREPGVFSQTHPDSAARAEQLRAWITERYGPPVGGVTSRDEHLAMLNTHYLALMEDQLDTNRFGRTEELLQRHKDMGVDPGLVEFFYGEMYRQRGESGDADLAMASYRKSADSGSAPPESHRNMGYLLLKAGDVADAQEHFRKYLELNPDATDRAMIEFYLEEEP